MAEGLLCRQPQFTCLHCQQAGFPPARSDCGTFTQSAHILDKNILSSKFTLVPARTHTHNACLLHFPLLQIFSVRRRRQFVSSGAWKGLGPLGSMRAPHSTSRCPGPSLVTEQRHMQVVRGSGE